MTIVSTSEEDTAAVARKIAAGDMAEAGEGQIAMIASDIVNLLGETLSQLTTPQKGTTDDA